MYQKEGISHVMFLICGKHLAKFLCGSLHLYIYSLLCREIHPKELVTAGYRSARYYFKTKDLFGVAEPWRAILDGDEFKMQPMEAFRDGAWNNDKPIVMGSAADEIYIPAYWPFNMRKELYQV